MDFFDKIAEEIDKELDYERRRIKRLRNWSYTFLLIAILTIPLRFVFPEYAIVFRIACWVFCTTATVLVWKT